ncbi:hypothetical protein N7510_009634 [Penicillium lagena]|uniref:uncharacterized protein n=1 Tax=Penicillium lagena TaxID=94218 RepID=UPI0025421E6C|nr:uncharacterized protein N7510_009634 [Penicillium lagena]KAJ5604480.1 hypothetical protein N7510_009634 [Penicillium lagena]
MQSSGKPRGVLTMLRSYENALKLLNSQRRNARPKAVNAPLQVESQGSSQALRGLPSLSGMKEWLQLLGHSDRDINGLNIVHVTGTKGKGSTCAFTRCLLRAHGLRTGFPKRVGLYTSPDLRCIRERIQIDDKPITEDLFTKYFFEVWDCLFPVNRQSDAQTLRQPRFLQLLALTAFHAFIGEKVEAAIFETHHGGEYDATNVIQKPVVTGITSLGLDHVEQLGPTIENIAWHKSGIFKTGSPAFSLPQEPSPAAVMRKRAAEKGTTLSFVSVNDSLLPGNTKVLGVPVQRLNFSLALELSKAFLHSKGPGSHLTGDDISLGVERFSWPGRFEIIDEGVTRWFLDGAHNELSIGQAAEWYAKITNSCQRGHRVLIFTHFSEERDGPALLRHLVLALLANNAAPDHVIFTTYKERKDGSTRFDKMLKVPESSIPEHFALYSSIWKELDLRVQSAKVSTAETIEEAIQLARDIASQEGQNQVFITGSLYLVGGALNILQPEV